MVSTLKWLHSTSFPLAVAPSSRRRKYDGFRLQKGHEMSDDADFSPMLYDVMRELAVQLSGRYVEWMDVSANSTEEKH